MLSLVRGKPTTTESVKLLLTPLEDPSMAVRCAALQKLREVLRSKREWLAQLLADSTTAVNQDAAAGETMLLAALTEALLKSCNAEVRLERTFSVAWRPCACCQAHAGWPQYAALCQAASPLCLQHIQVAHDSQLSKAALDELNKQSLAAGYHPAQQARPAAVR